MMEDEREYHMFRDHDTEFGWGIKKMGSDKILALVHDKSLVGAIESFLNGEEDRAQSLRKTYIESQGYKFQFPTVSDSLDHDVWGANFNKNYTEVCLSSPYTEDCIRDIFADDLEIRDYILTNLFFKQDERGIKMYKLQEHQNKDFREFLDKL